MFGLSLQCALPLGEIDGSDGREAESVALGSCHPQPSGNRIGAQWPSVRRVVERIEDGRDRNSRRPLPRPDEREIVAEDQEVRGGGIEPEIPVIDVDGPAVPMSD